MASKKPFLTDIKELRRRLGKFAKAFNVRISLVTGKQVELRVQVNPAIVGGLIVKLGSRMVDSSLRTKLNSLRHAMKEVS